MAQAITDADFEKEVLQAEEVVMVDFWAPWCGPCRHLAPIVEELATEYEGRAKIVKINVDDHPQAAGQYGIRGIPTLLFFAGGEQKDQIVGAQPKAAIADKLDKLIAANEA